jgi:hypothetical protein
MKQVAQLLAALFKVAKGVGTRTGRGLLQHATGKYAVRGVQRLNLRVGNVLLSYEKLNEFDQAVVKEVSEYASRFAWQYIDHHDEYTPYRIQGSSLEDVVWSHAQEIFDAGYAALQQRLRSHGYDYIVGKSTSKAIFSDEAVMKQLVMAVIQEAIEDVRNSAE